MIYSSTPSDMNFQMIRVPKVILSPKSFSGGTIITFSVLQLYNPGKANAFKLRRRLLSIPTLGISGDCQLILQNSMGSWAGYKHATFYIVLNCP